MVCTPVIPGTQETEKGELQVLGQPVQFSETASKSKIKRVGHVADWWSASGFNRQYHKKEKTAVTITTAS